MLMDIYVFRLTAKRGMKSFSQGVIKTVYDLRHLLLTWFNCNPSIAIYNHISHEVWDETTHPFPNFNGSVEV